MTTTSNGLMTGKQGLIFGYANQKSIAWGIAKAVMDAGGKVMMSCINEQIMKKRESVRESHENLVEFFPCDVSDSASLDSFFQRAKTLFHSIDFLVHSIAFSDKNELRGRFCETSNSNFLNSMNISCYSFIELARRALPLMKNGSSIVTVSYYGSSKVIENYNVMGVCKAALEASVIYLADDLGVFNKIRVNALSPGPIKTLAASGIKDFDAVHSWGESNSPLRRGVELEEIGNAGLYLLSDLSSGVTGSIHYVDCGASIMGMKSYKLQDGSNDS